MKFRMVALIYAKKQRVLSPIICSDINLSMERDNWFIIKNSLASFEQAVKVYYQATEPVSSIAKSAGSSSSSKSNLGWPFNGSNKEKVLKLYENLSESKMWKLSTGKYVEKAMYDMVKNLNYEQ